MLLTGLGSRSRNWSWSWKPGSWGFFEEARAEAGALFSDVSGAGAGAGAIKSLLSDYRKDVAVAL